MSKVGSKSDDVAATSSTSNATKCGSCGSTAIEYDGARGDAVCTDCGDVLESSAIVSDIQFEENAHGGASAIGQFVSTDSKGGGQLAGGRFGGIGGGGRGPLGSGGLGRESREITLRNARNKIRVLCQQLGLRQDRIDMSFNFFRMALARNLTRGRKSTHVIASCVYITCRTEGTSHMLIDFSDILQIDVYELGRTYLKLCQELCINIPAMDPCLYVMRFAHKLEFGPKTHEVSMTALRLVSRMKKDWIHFGRRPSGLCGAALLIAGRMHMYNRSVGDVIKVVKVHESTLRKRLNEFGETPASQLTLEEFMNIDLDAMTEEQDPPSFKAARKKDRERMLQLEKETDIDDEITELEKEIEKQLAERRAKSLRGPYAKYAKEGNMSGDSAAEDSPDLSESEEKRKANKSQEDADMEKFIQEDTMGLIQSIVNPEEAEKGVSSNSDSELMPPPKSTPVATTPSSATTKRKFAECSPGLGLRDTIDDYLVDPKMQLPKSSPQQSPVKNGQTTSLTKSNGQVEDEDEGLDLTGIDDDEIDGYIMSNEEIKFKTDLWMRVNAVYLKEKAEKEERERLEEEEAIREGRTPKKKKKPDDRKKKQKANLGDNRTALEAIEKMVQEKKISTKINYEVLRSLNAFGTPTSRLEENETQGPLEDEDKTMSTPNKANAENDSDSAVETSPAGSTSSVFGKSPLPTPAGISKVFAPAVVKEKSTDSGDTTNDAEKHDESVKSSTEAKPPASKRFKKAAPSLLVKKERVVKKSTSVTAAETSGTSDESGTVVESADNSANATTSTEPIIESGPVESSSEEKAPLEESLEAAYEEEFDEEEEDESCLSAAQLLSKHRGDSMEEEFYEEDYY